MAAIKCIIFGLCLALFSLTASAQQLPGAITPAFSASAEATHLVKATPGKVWGAYATNLTTTAGFLVLIDATAVPVDGAITPQACVPLPASGAASINYIPSPPAQFSKGIVAAVTSASTCFTLTSNVITAFIAVVWQ